MGSSGAKLEPKVEVGDGGYVLEDVPHLTDYIPHLPVSSFSAFFFSSCFDEESWASWMVMMICVLNEVKMELFSCWYWLVLIFLC